MCYQSDMGQAREDDAGSGCGWMLLFGIIFLSIAKCSSNGAGSGNPSWKTSETAYVTASALNCRADHTTDAPIVTKFVYGEELSILDRNDGWALADTQGDQCWASDKYLSNTRPSTKSTPRPQTLYSPPQKRAAPARSCGAAPYCTGMSSCEEAQFYFRQCGVSRLDGDNDGVPCENLC